LRHSITELGRSLTEIGSNFALAPLLKTLPRGDGHSIITLPGFMGADGSTARLRKLLNGLGYHALPWGLGRNAADVQPQSLDDFLEHRKTLEAQVAEQIAWEYQASGGKVTLIGWSLGGLYAVALAHRYPQWIRQVITLGTPYGDPRGTALYKVMGRLYNNEVQVDEEALQRWVEYNYLGGDLKVPVLALYSKTDGIVGTGIARCQGDPAFVTNLAVPASHVGFPFNPIVFAVIANQLAPDERRWAICSNRGFLKRS
jgi:dienelactone hydrolase